ncbi:MAG: hypothetical protein WD065_14750, partial [Planctomycetaceae bacterium]
ALGIDVGTAETPISNFSGKNIPNLSQPLHMLNGPAKKDANQQVEPQSRSRRMAQSKENLDLLRDQELLLREQEQIQKNERQAQIESQVDLNQNGAVGGMMGGMGGMPLRRSGRFGSIPGGGMGGMGGGGFSGGMGRMDVAQDGDVYDDQISDNVFTMPLPAREGGYWTDGVAAWTQRGGLSLPIDLPTSGQKLVFSKVTGSPRLALSLRTRETVATGVGFVWTLVWFAAAIVLVVSVLRFGLMSQIFYRLPEFLLAIGVVGYFLMPRGFGGFAVLFLVMFVAGVIALAVRRRRAVAAA